MPEFERLEQLEIEIAQLRTALQTRIIIEQAKGVLSVVLEVTPDEAFQILRREARSNHAVIHDLAREVIDTRGARFANPS